MATTHTGTSSAPKRRSPVFAGKAAVPSLVAALLAAACTGGAAGNGAGASGDGVAEPEGAPTEFRSFAMRGAERARTELEMRSGVLVVSGGAPAGKVAEATFRFDEPASKPEISLDRDGGEAVLAMRQPEGAEAEGRYDWRVSLGEEVPNDLVVRGEQIDADLGLSGVPLSNLDARTEVGTLDVDLTGKRAEDLDARIAGEAMDVTLRLPEDVRARVEVPGRNVEVDPGDLREEGGAYVNGAHGGTGAEVRVSVELEAGSVTVETPE
jgi:hypothetical protein